MSVVARKDGEKWMVTYIDLHSFAAAAVAPSSTADVAGNAMTFNGQ